MFIQKILVSKLIFAIYLVMTLVSSINSQQDNSETEKILKKSKVLACIALTKARLSMDQV